MNIQFNFGPKNIKTTNPQNISVRVYHNSLDFRSTTHLEVFPSEWDFTNKRTVDITKGKRTFERSQYLIKVISILNHIEEIYSSAFITLKLSTNIKSIPKDQWNSWCRDILEDALGKKTIISEPSNELIVRFKNYLESHRLGFRKNTIKGYVTVIGLLESFMDFKKLIELNPLLTNDTSIKKWYFNKYGSSLSKSFKCTELDLDFFYTSLQEWMHMRGYKPNYFGTVIQKIKAVIRYYEATDSDFKYHSNLKSNAFITIRESPEHDILTPQEIEAIENYSGKNYLENTRDLLLVQYFACLRFNELAAEISKGYSNLKLNTAINENGEEYLLWEIYQSKTKRAKSIGVFRKLENILKTRCPYSISSQKYNEWIKELTRAVGINNKRITSHTIRRSFCTNMYNANQNIQDIMQYSGHDNEDKFRLYVKQKNVNRDNQIPLM
jgi:integrase